MLRALTEAANSVIDFIKFTGEESEGERAVPVLDTQMWFGRVARENKWYEEEDSPRMENSPEGYTVMYKFFKKPVASKLGILGRSACPEKMKVTTATAEYLRRWKNTTRCCP